MTKRQFEKAEKRVTRIFDRFPKKIQKMLYDDDFNLYGPVIKNLGYGSEINIAYYVVLGKNMYVMVLGHDFTRSYGVLIYKNTIFGDKNRVIKKYEGPTMTENLISGYMDILVLVETIKNRLKQQKENSEKEKENTARETI